MAGRLRPGLIRSGDIYSLESWQELVEVIEVKGANLDEALLARLREQSIIAHPEKTYSIATTSYLAGELQRKLGRVENRLQGSMLRDLTVAYLKSHGFSAFTS